MIYNLGVFSKSQQSGATLIVVLVILIAMTFLGLSSMSDNNLQLAMVRNSQLQTAAYTAALTEINAQIDDINGNDANAVITNLVEQNINEVNGVEQRSTTPNKMLATVTDDEYAASFDTTFTLTELNPGVVRPATGFTIAPGANVKMLQIQMNSTASIKNTTIRSQQIQGLNYLVAN